jgi:coproporphyrinogen III oxidase-like Fe-S oxidoreductase
MIENLVGHITRQEGKKFLTLNESIDERAILKKSPVQDTGISLYVHIPFCRTLCPFCCFNRYLFKEDQAHKYFEHLKKELSMYIDRGYRFSHFYFGGGTPTILMDELTAFIALLRKKFDVKQISLETTAREINENTVEQLKKAGVNRLSIGIQSFDTSVLKTMGRMAMSPEELQEKLVMAEGNFDTLNMDMVFNFPGQTIKSFAADVETFKRLKIDQATFYPLMPSPHKKEAMERQFNRVSFSQEREFYNIILKELYHDGYKASTAWCFSRGDHAIDEYIIDFDDYIGIGSGSVSILNGVFYVNSFSLEKYGDYVSRGRLPIIGWRALSEREALRYYLLTKLFGMELDRRSFFQRYHENISSKLRLELSAFRMFGLIEGKEKIHVTDKGMYPVSVMMREFFASLNTLRERCIEQQI